MSNAERLAPLADYAGQLEDAAARTLAASANKLRVKEAELAQLRSYLAEYRLAAAATATDVARWNNTQAFLARLGEAVKVKEREVEQTVEAHRLEAQQWRAAQRSAEVLEKFMERAELRTRRERADRDQRELDEHAARYGVPPSC